MATSDLRQDIQTKIAHDKILRPKEELRVGGLYFPVTKKEAERKGERYSQEANRNAEFPTKLRELREEAGVSQAAFALKLGISKSTLGLYENGDTLPDASTLKEMAKFFKVSADYLLGLSNAKSTDETLSGVCKYTGLTGEAVEALSFSMRSRSIKAKIIDHLISAFYLEFIALNLFVGLKNDTKAELAKGYGADDLIENDQRYYKWRFMDVCGLSYEKIKTELAPLLKKELEGVAVQDLKELEASTATQLLRIQELIEAAEKPKE